MKRSKIFLGMVTAILAVAAFAAERTHKFSRVQAYYNIGSGSCTLSAGAKYYTGGYGERARLDGIYPLYSYHTIGCIHPLYTY